jgi:hypothetical protein
MRFGSDQNLATSQYQVNTVGSTVQGMLASSYTSNYGGNNVKVTTSRITGSNEGLTTSKLEGTYTTREAVPITTRKYQFH